MNFGNKNKKNDCCRVKGESNYWVTGVSTFLPTPTNKLCIFQSLNYKQGVTQGQFSSRVKLV